LQTRLFDTHAILSHISSPVVVEHFRLGKVGWFVSEICLSCFMYAMILGRKAIAGWRRLWRSSINLSR
jgi:hypothetical protein